jgi:Spy/CpxP family protein refolding chaperone
MKKSAVLLMAVMMLLSAASVQSSGQGAGVAPTTQASKPADDLGVYAEMVPVCKLADDQVAKLKEKVAALRDGNTAFWKENQDKVAKLNKDLVDARTAKDDEKVASLQKELKGYLDKSRQLYVDNQAAILAVLTPPQRLAWDSYNLRKDLDVRYRRITFTEEQETKVKAFCDDAAKDIGKIKDPTDYTASGEIRNAIARKIDEMLTPEQKDLLPRSLTSMPAVPK